MHFSSIPKCTILGVHIAALNMDQALAQIRQHMDDWSGQYICISNVHTTVMSSEDAAYRDIQNQAVLALPDGNPLAVACRRRGYPQTGRVTGPDLMGEIFQYSKECGYTHYFYGGTEETLRKLRLVLEEKYHLEIAGMYAPPFRPLTSEEDMEVVRLINEAAPDFIWVCLGAPKQERWMAEHQGRVHGLMIGVGAGVDFHAGNIRRAPGWMQRLSLEWLYRLIQDPKRLFKRYLVTNCKFLWRVYKEKGSYAK